MSQGGVITATSNPSLPTSFVTNSGTATPSGNSLNILGGTGITVSGSGSTVTITATGSEQPWTDEAVSFNAAVGNGYFITNTATATLPSAPSQGNVVIFTVDTASILTIRANTGQFIRIAGAVSASAGSAANNIRGDSVTLVYRSADTTWLASVVIGTWTVT